MTADEAHAEAEAVALLLIARASWPAFTEREAEITAALERIPNSGHIDADLFDAYLSVIAPQPQP